ncbi:hypothetical protein HK103_002236 [Boothiomyces macroporosus]|uniref:Alpha-ketoglutarate-dependent dioxygenase AlkB-like domain-containing protein n=1 Tax=Boothiomyces macroporosus TaxID=261099 RepID=A0AAD5Y043_9FUNG|nr:hypothetical protein HK103_002236 [Boothiomyces macroporosus]
MRIKQAKGLPAVESEQPKEIPSNIPDFPIYFYEPAQIYTTDPTVLPIKGMQYIPNYVTPEEAKYIWDTVYDREFSTLIHRRQQFYGQRYYHTTCDLKDLQPTEEEEFKCYDLELFQGIITRLENDGFFEKGEVTQILVNEYAGAMGISNHFDDSNAFGDTIVTISVGKPVWLTLTSNEDQTKVFLEENSLFCMKEDARYKYRHGIPKAQWVRTPDGQCIKRGMDYIRISLTIRKLLDTRKKVEEDITHWDECLVRNSIFLSKDEAKRNEILNKQ